MFHITLIENPKSYVFSEFHMFLCEALLPKKEGNGLLNIYLCLGAQVEFNFTKVKIMKYV